ncbi:MAG: hypothetical protein ACRC9V_02950, partial [Aeromonas sp.]
LQTFCLGWSSDMLIHTDNMSVVSYINCQGVVLSRPLFKQAASLLLWAARHLLFIRATPIPGRLNRGADMLSKEGLPHREWSLHPNSLRWHPEGGVTSMNVHCLLFFLLADAVTMRWLDVRLNIFPPVKILPLVLCKIREEIASGILVAPFWPNQAWFPDLKSC